MSRDNSYLIGNKFAKGSGRNRTSFKKRHKPWNRGLGGLRLSPATEFKKGHITSPPLPVGTIRQRKDKNGKMRNFIKIAIPNKWRELSHVCWKQAFGFLPGDVVHHINGNLIDDRLTNLIAIPRQDHPRYHSRWGLNKFTVDDLRKYLARYQSPHITYPEFTETL